MKKNIGRCVAADDFFAVVDRGLGAGAHKRLQIECTNGNLVDIYINLPAEIPADASLAELIQQAPENFSSRCREFFKVDAIGF